MMRRILFVISLLCAVLASGCNKDPKTLFADFRWGVECSSSGSCTGDGPPREVLGFDGQPNEGDTMGDVNVSCSFNRSGGQAIVSISAIQPGYAIQVDGLVINDSGTSKNQSPSCSVGVVETEPFDLTLEGACEVTNGDGAPCDVNAEVTRVDGDPTLNVLVHCVGITSPSDPASIIRDLTLGSVTTPADAPEAILQVRNCPGQ